MTHTVRKLFAAAALLILMSALLAGCGCRHDWQEATCMAPRTCARCGETEGKIRSHKWEHTDCTDPHGCIFCGTLEGIELTHQWRSDCRICIHCGHDARPADDRFRDQLTLGLEEKLILIKDAKARREDPTADFSREDWEAIIDSEYSRLADFAQDNFVDPVLGAEAKYYVNCIIDSKAMLEDYGSDDWVNNFLNGIYHSQRESLFRLHTLKPITVSEENTRALEDMLEDGQIIQLVNGLFDQVMFLQVSYKNGEWKYETTVTNDTVLNFENFTFEIDLLDEEGEIILTQTSTTNNWKPGKEVRFNFTTTLLFHAIRVDSANWVVLPD